MMSWVFFFVKKKTSLKQNSLELCGFDKKKKVQINRFYNYAFYFIVILHNQC
jgi:hypothetical protein